MDSLTDSHNKMQSVLQPQYAIAVNASTRPDPAISEQPRWICWKYTLNTDQKLKKPPYDPRTGRMIDITRPATWLTYDEALHFYLTQKYHGIGYIFLPNECIRIDLDGVRNPATGELSTFATRVIDYMNSYTELSPSGDGVHILALGKLGDRDRKLPQIEMYCHSSTPLYLTWTGQCLGEPRHLMERSEQAQVLYQRVYWQQIWEEYKAGRKENTWGGKQDQDMPALDLREERNLEEIAADERLLERARTAKNGATFRRLYDELPVGASQHEDDYRLCLLLLYWTQDRAGQPDPSRAWRLFLHSERYQGRRRKWHRKLGAYTYGEVTMWKAYRDRYVRWEPGAGSSAEEEQRPTREKGSAL